MELQSAGDPGGQEARLRLVIEAAPNAMMMVDSQGRIVLANTEAERSFGYTRDELLRMRVEDLVPARLRAGHSALRTAYAHQPSRRGMGVGRELHGLRKDGTEMPIEIGLNPIVMNTEQYVLASVIDITARLREQAAEVAAGQDELRRLILDTIPFSIIATDARGRIMTTNPAAELLLGYRQEELVGRQLTHIDGAPRELDGNGLPVLRAIEDAERTYRTKSGTLVPVNESIAVLQGGMGDEDGLLIVSYDISKRVESRERVEFMLNHDTLTGLPNRAAVMNHLTAVLAAAVEHAGAVALAILDLDHFKRINDSLGHHIGDDLLVHVARRLDAWAGEIDVVGRLGGDEYALVFTGDTQADIANGLERLSHDVLGPIEVRGYELLLTASIGAAVFPQDGRDPATLLMHADIALHDAKASGRHGIRWFAPRMLQENHDKLALSAALRQALEAEELSLVYQPQLDLRTGHVVGFEALARWDSRHLGPVPPSRFIPVAEDGGMITDLGQWVLRTACVDIAVLQRQLGTRMRIAVNVSPRQVRSAGWVASVAKAVADAGLDADQLELEITEGLMLDDHEDVIAALEAVRALGVQVVVDDFGQGYSSLAYLNRFPVDKIKIDRTFIQEIGSTGDNAAVVDAIIVMAHALGMAVVAEGVETTVQERYLRERRCDEAQGYLYGAGKSLVAAVEAVGRFSVDGPVICHTPAAVETSELWTRPT